MEAHETYRTVPGPRDRETFFRAQRRHRRARFWLAVATAVATAFAGVPLAVMLAPWVLAAAVVAIDVLNLVIPMPDPYGEFTERLFRDREGPWFDSWQEAAIASGVLVAAGSVAALFWWQALHRYLRRGALTGVPAHLGARPADPADPAEARYASVVAEMSIAAGLAAPRVLVVDSPSLGLAACGRSHRSFAVLAGSGAVHRFSRDELQGAVATVVASVGNGDLQMATTTAAAALVHDVVPVLSAAPFSREARRLLRVLLRGAPRDPGDFHATLDRLSDPDGPVGTKFAGLVASLASMLVQLIAACVARPWQGAFWRRRSALADAGAVQLTRYPDGLARALLRVSDADRVLLVSPLLDFTALAGDEVHAQRKQYRVTALASRPGAGGMLTRSAQVQAIMSEPTESIPEGWGQLGPAAVRPWPVVRLRRLGRMGATVEVPPDPRRTRPRGAKNPGPLVYLGMTVLLAVFVVLVLVGAVFVLSVLVVMLEVGLLIGALLVAPVHYLLRRWGRA